MRNIIEFIRTCFCKHDWECIKETMRSAIFKCKKCGKTKIFWD